MKRILVVNVNWVGDVIFSSPVFKALKKAYPDARISCLAVPRVKGILESIPYVDDIIEYDEKGKHRTPLGKLGLILRLRLRHFDGAFLLHRSLTRALFVFFAGIPVRVGYDEKGRGRFLTHKTEFSDESWIHRSDYYLRVIESFGVTVDDRRCELSVDQNAQARIRELLASKGVQDTDYLIVINPGGNWELKRWAPENFAALINRLCVEVNAKIVMAGASQDVTLVRHIFSCLNENARAQVIDLAGETDLRHLVALLKRADLLISADSGPLHLANSVGCEVVSLFGPTRPEVTGPRGSGKVHVIQHDVGCNREPCYHLGCPENTCMKSIGAHDVLEIIRQIKR